MSYGYRCRTSRDLRRLSGLVPFFGNLCFIRVKSLARGFLLRLRNANLVFGYAGNARDSLRFKDRRERNFHPFRCGAQLGPEEFALADADGVGLLRHRVDGHGCVTIRYFAVRRRSNALLAASM